MSVYFSACIPKVGAPNNNETQLELSSKFKRWAAVLSTRIYNSKSVTTGGSPAPRQQPATVTFAFHAIHGGRQLQAPRPSTHTPEHASLQCCAALHCSHNRPPPVPPHARALKLLLTPFPPSLSPPTPHCAALVMSKSIPLVAQYALLTVHNIRLKTVTRVFSIVILVQWYLPQHRPQRRQPSRCLIALQGGVCPRGGAAI
jgi:hypothetical protein